MAASMFWYDFESTGISPSADRPLQVAGVRTDEDLNEIEPPINLYCQLPEDCLPHPQACLVTGITPQTLADKGIAEAQFIAQLHAQVSRPETCVVGFNNLRFDDEMLRYTYWRNFYDPYAREWQGNNSRWDVLDMLRCAYALRPEGIVWPEQDGQVSLRLELLTAANGINHGEAHEALADVRATIAVARLVKQAQPKLYDYLFGLRRKQKALEQLQLFKPVVHVSGRFSAARHYLAVVLPIARHPSNSNAWVVVDLQSDISPLLQLSAEAIKQRLYTRRVDLAEGELPIPLKLVHINRCPVLAPMSVLREQDIARLNLDMDHVHAQAHQLQQAAGAILADKMAGIYAGDDEFNARDPEQALYQGFLGNRDRGLSQQVREADAQCLANQHWPFDDERLSAMLPRYKARNYPEALTPEERAAWQARVASFIHGSAEQSGALEAFRAGWAQANVSPAQQSLKEAWLAYAQAQADKYLV